MSESAMYARYVGWFRDAAPYINAHRDQIFVIQFGGEAAGDVNLIHDLALLNSLGIRLVLVHGARPQIERRLIERGLSVDYAAGLRVTDATALQVVKEAVGALRVEIEALLSMGLANSPMAGARIRVASGNFVTARPIGVRDGVDFGYTGEVRRVDQSSIRNRLDQGAIVVVSPLGYSPTGEIFNLHAEEVATAIAIEIRAAKLLLLGEGPIPVDDLGRSIRQLTLSDAKQLFNTYCHAQRQTDETSLRQLKFAIHACRHSVRRAHLLDRRVDGALLLELFTRDGIGVMLSGEPFEQTRRATIDDAGGILALIQPMEEEGLLVRRSREKLETEIHRFLVMERDSAIIACAAVYPFPADSVVELACLAVHPSYRNGQRGDALLAAAELDARALGATWLFVLTTRAAHWFLERGFKPAAIQDLPVARQAIYNYQRNSKVLIKRL
ncbi:MAG: amino-acid N-acetyltransferase [Gammaproteobacteria bacterium]